MSSQCTCGKPTKDNAYVCEDCLTALAKALGEIPWTDEQLEISITKQRASAIGGGGTRSTGTPLPWHEKASDAQRSLHATLSTWVRFCIEEHVRNRGASTEWPADNLASMSRWMLWRVDGLAFHEAGSEVVDEITDAVAQAQRIVFWRKRERVYLGRCDATIEPEGAESYKCEGDVYAEQGAIYGSCEHCAAPYSVEKRRADLHRELDDRLCTAAEIARLATYLGLEQPRERVRKQVNSWHKRERITASGHSPEGDPVFRYGAVKALLFTQYARDTA